MVNRSHSSNWRLRWRLSIKRCFPSTSIVRCKQEALGRYQKPERSDLARKATTHGPDHSRRRKSSSCLGLQEPPVLRRSTSIHVLHHLHPRMRSLFGLPPPLRLTVAPFLDSRRQRLKRNRSKKLNMFQSSPFLSSRKTRTKICLWILSISQLCPRQVWRTGSDIPRLHC